MKKVYLSVILCCFAFAGFATTWYSSNPAGAGDASNLNHWWSNPDSSGTNPLTFGDPGDTFIVQTNMMTSAPLSLGGSLIISNGHFYSPGNNISIGGNLALTGGATIEDTLTGSGDQNIDLAGNLTIIDSAYIINNPAYTIVSFNNSLSTITNPQTIMWTSTEQGDWARIFVTTGSVVKLLSNVTLPPNPGAPDIIEGTLICENFVLDCNTNSFSFQLDSHASLYTANIYGVDSTVKCDGGFFYSSSANYVFNGTLHQATGTLTPPVFSSTGSVTINNSAGVTLSQSTTFGGISTLALTSGNLSIGAAQLNLAVSASLTGTFSSSSMIITNGIGMLQKQFSVNGVFTYPIGDTASNYSPITLSITGTDYSEDAYVGANVTNAKHPFNHNVTDFLNRYWSVTVSGITSPSYSVSATYVPGDVVGAQDSISMGQFTSTLPWIKFGAADTTTHTLAATGITNISSDFTGISTALPTVSITPSLSICNGDSAILSVVTIGTDTPFTYSWAPSTGLLSTTGSSITTNTTSTVTYTLTVTDANGFTATDTTMVTVNPRPNVYSVTGGGTYCAGIGANVGLNGSDASDSPVVYQLFLNDTTLVGASVNATGSAIDFGSEIAPGTYTVTAINGITGCSIRMDSNAVNIANPLPILDTVTGGGGYCIGAAGVPIGLSSSSAGISYQLYNGMATVDTAVTGTGLPIDFGIHTDTGSYTVIATDPLTSCASVMMNNAVVVINSLPAVYAVTGSGSYCSGTGGLPVGLNGSDTGVNYQLYLNDTTVIGSAVAGTGTILDFGMDTAAGTYTAIGVNAATGCSSNMAESATITVIPSVIPSVTITSSIADTICEGTMVTFSASAINGGGEPGYQWLVNDTTVSFDGSSYSYVPVNGDVLSVMITSDELCAIPNTATDSVTINVHAHMTPSVSLSVAPNDTVCQGTTVVITATPVFGGDAPSYAWVKNMVVVSTDSFYSFIPANDDNVYCVMESNYFCRTATTAYSNVIDMTVEAPVVPSVSIIAHPGTVIGIGKADTLVAVVTNGGTNPSYQWYLNGTPVGGAINSTYYKPNFAEKDSVSCIVTRHDACGLSTFNSVIISVNNLDVKQTAYSVSDIKLVPNPNNGTFTVTGSLGVPVGTDEEVAVEITDMLGQVVYKSNVMLKDGAISQLIQTNNTLSNGIYILNLRSASGSNAIRFVIGQ